MKINNFFLPEDCCGWEEEEEEVEEGVVEGVEVVEEEEEEEGEGEDWVSWKEGEDDEEEEEEDGWSFQLIWIDTFLDEGSTVKYCVTPDDPNWVPIVNPFPPVPFKKIK